jgi:hypothetical protein
VTIMNDNKNHHGARRRAAMLAVTVGIALLASGCGGGSTPNGSGDLPAAGGPSNNTAKEVAYAHCLSSHGAVGVSVGSGGTLNINSNTANTNSRMSMSGNGPIPSQVLDQNPTLRSAANACKSLAPSGGPPGGRQAPSAQDLAQSLKYAECIRKHGIPNLPDPSSSGAFNLSGTGINPWSPQFQAAQQACKSEMPAQISFSNNSRIPS